MSLNLCKPIAVFDLETTNVDIETARIISVGIAVIGTDGSIACEDEMLFNPGVAIPPESTEVNGITDEMVKNCPAFSDRARDILDKLNGCHLAGYNIEKFDLPILRREFARAGMDNVLKGAKVIDAMVIYRKNVRHDLSSAVGYYLNRSHENAHTASADARATAEVLVAQIKKHNLPRDAEGLDAYCRERPPSFVDQDGIIVWKGDEAVFNFGKLKGVTLKDSVKSQPEYLKWILAADFTDEVKEIVRTILSGVFPRKK